MPNLTDINRNVKIGTDDLVIKGTRLNNVDGANITAKYGTGNSYTTLGFLIILQKLQSQNQLEN